jgi:hypothetical protein
MHFFKATLFAPPDLLAAFSRGVTRFFEGDLASVLYILTPMLGKSLRHVLKMSGQDVTSFGDASQVQQHLLLLLARRIHPEPSHDPILGLM